MAIKKVTACPCELTATPNETDFLCVMFAYRDIFSTVGIILSAARLIINAQFHILMVSYF